jgi:hypothetical protein
VIEVSDTDYNQIAVTESTDNGDNKFLMTKISLQARHRTHSDYRMIVYCDGKVIPINQALQIAASNIRQNLYVVGDVDIMIPSYLHDMELDEEPAASDSAIVHISGAMVPGL